MDVQTRSWTVYSRRPDSNRGTMEKTADHCMTAHPMKGDRRKIFDAGLSDYVTKPVRFEEVRNMLARWAPHSQHGNPMMRSSGPETQAVSPESAKAPVDAAQAISNLGDDRELFLEVLAAFVDGIPQQLEELSVACSRSDLSKLKAIGHTLKGSAANVCAEPTRDLARHIEELSAEGSAAAVEKLLPDLKKEVNRLCEYAATLAKQA